MIPADGGEPRIIDDDFGVPVNGGDVAWSPDGKALVVVCQLQDNPKDAMGLHIARLSGGGLQRIVTDPEDVSIWGADWR